MMIFTLKMDKLHDNLKLYAEILKNCSLPQVGKWKLGDVQRGFQWARYFSNVQSRINHKPNVVRKLDAKLREIGCDLGVRFGGQELSYDFLTDSSEYFAKNLLDNPALPKELEEAVLNYTPTVAEQLLDRFTRLELNFPQHASEVAESKLLLTALTQINDCLLECFNEDNLRDLKPLDAEYLREDLTWLLASSAKSKVNERLHSLSQIHGGMTVILLCLLQQDQQTMSPAVRSDSDTLDPTRTAILEWVVRAASSWKQKKEEKTSESQEGDDTPMDVGEEDSNHMQWLDTTGTLWHHDNSKLVAQVSLRYFDFFKAHIKFLVHKTSALGRRIEAEEMEAVVKSSRLMMEAGVQEGEGNADSAYLQEMEWVSTQWVELARTGKELREICVSVLTEKASLFTALPRDLTLSDSHINLPIESIWTTLLDKVMTA